jgi:hypothetical protein
MNAFGFASPSQNLRDSKTAGRILRKGATGNFFGAADQSPNGTIDGSLQTALLDMLANTEAGYAAVVEGVEEFLYQEELQAGRS